MKIVTVATKSSGYFEYLKQSCVKNGAELTVLGYGKKWLGYAWRIHLVDEFIRTLPDNEIVAFIDAYDVIMLRPVHELERQFVEFSESDTKIVVGCERHVQNLVELGSRLIFEKCNGESLNAGTYIGYVRNLKRVFSFMKTNVSAENDDDQVLFSNFCVALPSMIYMDADSNFFLTVTNIFGNFLDAENVTITNQRVRFYNNYPFFVHGNGNTDMNDLLKRLGYELSDGERNALRTYNFVSTFKKISYYIEPFVLILLIVILMILIYLIL